MPEQFSASKQGKIAPLQDMYFTPSSMIGWRSRVLFGFTAEEHVIHFSDMRGRYFRIKKVNEAEAYICEQLHEAITVADVLERTRLRYPDLEEKRVYRFLNLLMERALIEEKVLSPPPDIAVEDVQRYDRQLRFFGLFAQTAEDRFRMQSALSHATVTILGLGGVGNWVARHLAAMGVGHLRLVDYDVVERSNLNRQALYTPADLGQQKTEVAARVLTQFNPRLSIETMSLEIASPEDIERVIEGAAVAVLTADKPMVEIRRWMALASVRQHIPYVQGTLDAYLLQIGPFYHVPYTGCFVCREISMQLATHQAYLAQTETYKHSPREKPPLLGPLCGFVGSAVALEALRYLSKYQPPCTLGRYYVIDARTWTTQVEMVPRHEKCPVCGSLAEPLTGSTVQTPGEDNAESFRPHV